MWRQGKRAIRYIKRRGMEKIHVGVPLSRRGFGVYVKLTCQVSNKKRLLYAYKGTFQPG